ncbi:L-threonylcarbamoyladenylate synthase [Methanosphaera sp. WGK6]|uniref:L-threonylcarbamoyladenylate synthase n=1 Tax=Methanosphaera sp. WGK6 TaxID=1561964 RepID=UPI00084C0E53|nr:L-threonylcarbamoyladenylate synthase [Methanosphaera sp. WGK6]OED30877.1 translation factor sua5 [Methanosphaera sp. WGK6]
MNIIKNPDKEQLNKIRMELENGNLIVYPTDTIYGIAANIFDDNAVCQVFKTKKRSLNKPISICIHNMNQLKKLANIDNNTLKIMKELLPGPYTLLLEKHDDFESKVISNTNKIAIRMPKNEITYELTKSFPITSTSANISNKTTPSNINDIIKQLRGNIKTYIDVGNIKNNQPSTIIDLTKKYPEIIRKGQADDNLLKNILKINL